MTEKKAIRYSKSLTDAAINIFGDIIDKAYVTTWDINSSSDEVSERLSKVKFNVDDSGDIDYSAENIWIRFTNGRIIEFSNSEWAFICRADVENSYEA